MSAKYINGLKKYLKEKTNVDVYENCEVQSIKNDEKGCIILANKKEYSYVFKGGKVALCCGRWIQKLAPVVENIVKSVKQLVTYWKMKNA
jgi:glycine/D-amino acid oxidase-like deaminating enzyme